MKKSIKKQLSLLLSVLMAVTLLISNITVFTVNAQQDDLLIQSNAPLVLADIYGHWAQAEIADWVAKGFIKGCGDNTFKPDQYITKAEFIALVNRIFGYKEISSINFSDVKQSDWYHDEIAKAVEAGYIKGHPDGTVKPNSVISRHEVAMVISRIMRLEMAENSPEIEKMEDAKDIPAWCRGAIGAVLNKGYMKAFIDSAFKPGNPITRAEATVVLKNVAGSIFNVAGVYGDTTIAGNVTVSADGVILEDLHIKGDLYLTEGIGDGTVTFDNVTVDGNTLVCGGGMESIVVINSTLSPLGEIVVQKKDNKVRIEASGKTKVGKMKLRSGGKLEEKDLTGTGFEDVEVKTDEKKNAAVVQFDGDFKNVEISSKSRVEIIRGHMNKLKASEGSKDADINVLAGKIESFEINTKVQVEVSGGTVANVIMDKVSAGTILDVKEVATIHSLIAGASTEVKGKGIVEVAEVNANGVKFEVQPQKIIPSIGVTVQIGNSTINGTPTSESPEKLKDVYYENEAGQLNKAGLYNGISKEKFDPDLRSALDRQTGVIMLLRMFGQEDEALLLSDADANAKLAKFTDGGTVAAWAKKQVAYAVDKGLVKGIEIKGKFYFQPSAPLVGKAYALLILQQLGYSGDFNYNESLTELANGGGLTAIQAVSFDKALIKDEVVGMTYN
nr:S-layer homology domain-containing protein [Thermoclostridium sp.]